MSTRRVKYNRVKSAYYYTTKELSELLRIHRRTIENWSKVGLKKIDQDTRPILYSGAEVKDFLRNRRKNKKITLSQNEFYCPRCHIAVESYRSQIEFVHTGRILGSGREQVIVKGVCKKCKANVVRFSSSKQVKSDWLTEKNEEQLIINF